MDFMHHQSTFAVYFGETTDDLYQNAYFPVAEDEKSIPFYGISEIACQNDFGVDHFPAIVLYKNDGQKI
jgi:hypothetical protein